MKPHLKGGAVLVAAGLGAWVLWIPIRHIGAGGWLLFGGWVLCWIGTARCIKGTAVMRYGGGFVLACAILAGGYVAISGPASGRGPAPAQSPQEIVPDYKVVATQDVSMGAVRRLQVRVSLPEHYSRSAVERVAHAIVADTTKSQPVNAISILFYGPDTSTAGVYDVALVEWAPNGQWGDAALVQAGDYRTYRYTLSYNAPASTPPTGPATLTVSDHTGLLGVPLPSGARLMERTPADPALDRDPSERYAVSASAAEIAAFFTKVMPAAGWQKDGASTATALLFRKDKRMIGVLMNGGGGTFTLMGS